jgi:hypothetical protein
MPTLTYLDGFEHGSLSINDFGGIAAGVWDAIAGAAACSSQSGGRNGRCLQVSPAGATAFPTKQTVGAPGISIVSLYIKFTVLPTTDSGIFAMLPLSGIGGRLFFKASTGKFHLAISGTANGTDVGPVLSTGVWYKVDLKLTANTNPMLLDGQIDEGTNVQVSLAQTASTAFSWRFGQDVLTGTYTAQYDDFVASATSADYPIAAHKVLDVVPESDDVTNSVYGTNVMERASDGADINGTTVAAWDKWIDWPGPVNVTINSSDTVTQAATGTGNSARVNMEDTAETVIWGAVALAALMADAATACTGVTKVHYSTGATGDIYNGDMSEITVNFRTLVLSTALIDTLTEFNGLQMSGGYSSDAAPDPEWLALMIQYAVPEGGAPPAASLVAPLRTARDVLLRR